MPADNTAEFLGFLFAPESGAPASVECIKMEGRSDFSFPKKSVIRFDFPARGSMLPVKLFWHDGTHYRGRTSAPGYHCAGKQIVEGRGLYCLSIGGVAIDQAVANAFLQAVTPAAVEAT